MLRSNSVNSVTIHAAIVVKKIAVTKQQGIALRAVGQSMAPFVNMKRKCTSYLQVCYKGLCLHLLIFQSLISIKKVISFFS